jgi:[acyl-carrier-protein] S-malonyltransferase
MEEYLTVFQFPGQGSQKVGMGQDLYKVSPAAAAVFDQADDVLGIPLSQLCFEGPDQDLNDTFNTQPAILTTSIAVLRALQERVADQSAFVSGHSLGEFSALVAAKALSFQEALLLVRERGRLMKEADELCPGGMAAVIGLDVKQLESICAKAQESAGGYLGIANDNCPGQVVISGDESALAVGMELAKEAGAKRAIRLEISIAAHSPLMGDAAVEFKKALSKCTIKPPQITFVANATAGPLEGPEQIREALGRQLTSPVRWTESVQWMIEQGATRFVEVGPGEVLTGLVRRIDRSVERLTAAAVLSG